MLEHAKAPKERDQTAGQDGEELSSQKVIPVQRRLKAADAFWQLNISKGGTNGNGQDIACYLYKPETDPGCSFSCRKQIHQVSHTETSLEKCIFS